MPVALDRVTVRVPATVANLGAGFDVLAAAVGVHAEVTLEPASSPRVSVAGVDVPQDASNLIYHSAAAVAQAAGAAMRDAFAQAGVTCHTIVTEIVSHGALEHTT